VWINALQKGGVTVGRPEVQKPIVRKAPVKTPSVVKKAAPVKKAVVKKVAVRASTASTKLENRAVPSGHVRSRGVKLLLAERRARKH
jgi:hypothetical protein